MECVSRRAELDRAASGMGGMRGTLPGQNSVLSFPASGKTRDHGMGAGKLSLWRERRRRDAEADLRSLLHPALFPETRRHDRSENDLYDVCGKGPLKDQRSEIGGRR